MRLNELQIENIAHWPWIAKLIVIAISVIGLWLLFFFIDIKPLIYKIHREGVRQTELRTLFQQDYALAATLPTYKANLSSMIRATTITAQRLPQTWDMPVIIQTLVKTGQKCGLHFNSIKPQTALGYTQNTSPLGKAQIQISAQGSYHALGQFLSDLSQLNPIITLDNFNLRATSTDIMSSHDLKTRALFKPP